MRKILFATIEFLAVATLFSCKKLVAVDPPVSQPSADVVYNNDATATAVLTGLYNTMSAKTSFTSGLGGVSVISGLSADEFQAYPANSPIIQEAYTNSLKSTNVPFWTTIYNHIYTVNAVIESVSSSSNLSQSVRQQLSGEAKFMRAFFYFYLVNFFGDAPLILTTDYRVNSTASRAPKTEIYQQIVKDLKDAQDLLSPNFLSLDLQSPTVERIRPTKWAATALLARTYLYMGDYLNAEAQSSLVIGNVTTFSLAALNSTFLKNSSEAIWQLQPVVSGFNTLDGNVFVLTSAPLGNSPIAINPSLVNAFEINDARKTTWVGVITVGASTYYYPNKYKVKSSSSVSEYLMMLRLSEQYLIRAEARAQQNKIVEAQADLNVIRNRAGLVNTATSDKTALLTEILNEKRIELFSEWGHRWLDLKRTSNVDAVMNVAAIQKGAIWNSNWQLYPIPLSTLQLAPNLKQNSGY